MVKTFENIPAEGMHEVAKALLAIKTPQHIWTFHGQLGAGKTTLIREICQELGVQESVSSPTFSLVNEYHGMDGKVIYHFDFYRINHIREVYDIGYEDYFYSGNLCLIEWPEKIESLLEEDEVLRIRIEGNQTRTITVE